MATGDHYLGSNQENLIFWLECHFVCSHMVDAKYKVYRSSQTLNTNCECSWFLFTISTDSIFFSLNLRHRTSLQVSRSMLVSGVVTFEKMHETVVNLLDFLNVCHVFTYETLGFITSLNHHYFWIGICLLYCFPIMCFFSNRRYDPVVFIFWGEQRGKNRWGGWKSLRAFSLTDAILFGIGSNDQIGGRIREGSCFKHYNPKNRSWDLVSSEALYWKSWEARCCCSSSAVDLRPSVHLIIKE